MTRRRPVARVIVLGASVVLGVSAAVALALVVSACGAESSPDLPSAQGSAPSVSMTPAVPVTTGESATAVPAAAPGSDAGAPVSSASTEVSAPVSSASTEVSAPVSVPSRVPVTFTVLFDDHAVRPGTEAGHGFSCLVSGLEKTVLFDTGSEGDILLSNMEALAIEPGDIDAVVISHGHGDHTGGLVELLGESPAVTVYYPATCTGAFVRLAREAGAALAPIDAAATVCAGILATAPLGDPSESALLVETAGGRVLLTGCAHPGIVEMARAASDLVGEPVRVVMGGFHLQSASAGQVDGIIQELKDLGAEACGPAHCTGEAATARMEAAFGAAAFEMGVGASIVF